jgi:hypothetical protein
LFREKGKFFQVDEGWRDGATHMSALLITGLRLFYKEYVLTPRGKDMNPELGPVVAASPEKKLSYLWVLSKVILVLVIDNYNFV